MHIVLHEPEIPPNTGNVARLCAAMGARLHLVEPLGFSIDDKHLKRAGLDYWPHVDLRVWQDWAAFTAHLPQGARLVCSSSRRGVSYHRFVFCPGDFIVLGAESRGLPAELLESTPHRVRIPLQREAVRSLNLSTAAGVLLCEAMRQTGGFEP